MAANVFGHLFQVISFGESHGPAMGAVVDGCPAGVRFDLDLLKSELQRRRPGTSAAVSGRNEPDEVEVLSGVYEGQTLGTPIAMVVRNRDARSQDYETLKGSPRPGHADDLWPAKFGHADPRGGGRSSGRETVARVMGGAVAQMFARSQVAELAVSASLHQVGPLPPGASSSEVEELLLKAKAEGESHGGVAKVQITGTPRGLGQPVFRKLKSDLAAAMMSVGAASAVEFGAGFAAAEAGGVDFHSGASDVYGGIRGGLSTGEPIELRVGFKPTSSVMDVAKKGRHDPCIVPRALPVLEAMAWLVLADHLLWRRLDRA